MAGSFVRAGEKTNFGQYLYDFAASGVPGLKASLTYLRGHQIKATSGVGHDLNEWERNVRLDYVIQSGTFKGSEGTVRYALYHGSGTAGSGPATAFSNLFVQLFLECVRPAVAHWRFETAGLAVDFVRL